MTTSRHLPLRRFWLNDYGLHALLVTLLLTMFVAPVLVVTGLLPQLAVDVFFALMVVAGVATVWERGRLAFVTLVVASLALAFRWVSIGAPREWLALLDAAASATLVAVLAALIMVQVFRAGPITTHRIEGAVAVYLLAGVFGGIVYRFIWLLTPGAFVTAAGPVVDSGDLLYFSFVTLTTVGYGDITPVTLGARALAMLEALVGQLYPAILIARLVSLELVGRDTREEDTPSRR